MTAIQTARGHGSRLRLQPPSDSKMALEVTRATAPDRSLRPAGTGDGATPVLKSSSVGQPVVRPSTIVARPHPEKI
jgi:hypothetical protein